MPDNQPQTVCKYYVDKGAKDNDKTGVTLRIGNALYPFLGEEAEAILAVIEAVRLEASQPKPQSEVGLQIDTAVLAYARQCCEGEVRTIPDANAGQRFARELIRLAALSQTPVPTTNGGKAHE